MSLLQECESDVCFNRRYSANRGVLRMRLAIVALFLCAGAVGMCQSAVLDPKPLAPRDKSQQQTDCTKATPYISVSSFAPQQGAHRFEVPAWHWDGTRVDSTLAFHSPSLMPTANPCPWLALNGEPTLSQGLNQQRLKAQLEPIPTQWPDAKIEAIPTDWPGLQIVPIASRPGMPITMSVPTK
jgi:hypothetical protein